MRWCEKPVPARARRWKTPGNVVSVQSARRPALSGRSSRLCATHGAATPSPGVPPAGRGVLRRMGTSEPSHARSWLLRFAVDARHPGLKRDSGCVGGLQRKPSDSGCRHESGQVRGRTVRHSRELDCCFAGPCLSFRRRGEDWKNCGADRPPAKPNPMAEPERNATLRPDRSSRVDDPLSRSRR